MNYLAVAYPQWSEEDVFWIQSIREQYDPHCFLIRPHFTLVFPTNADRVTKTAFTNHLRQSLLGFTAFPCVIRCAVPVKDALSSLTHIFLVPDEGFSHIVKLHDAVYKTLLAAEQRLDIPYIPHITIGASTEPRIAKAIADHINTQNICVHGIVASVDAIQFDGSKVETIEQFRLATERNVENRNIVTSE
jgi:2'-5' RNA ligase